jgi:hypothetical protein
LQLYFLFESLVAGTMRPLEQREIPPKCRGRPRGSTRVPFQRLQDVWVTVEALRHALKAQGKNASVSEACRILAARDGLVWLIGGSKECIAKAVANAEKSSRLASVTRNSINEQGLIRGDKNGSIFVIHRLEAASIRARYVEAAKRVRQNPMIERAWTNLRNDLLGLPRLPVVGRPIPGLADSVIKIRVERVRSKIRIFCSTRPQEIAS